MPISRGVVLVSFGVRTRHSSSITPINSSPSGARSVGEKRRTSRLSLSLSLSQSWKVLNYTVLPGLGMKCRQYLQRYWSLKSYARCTQNVPQLNFNDRHSDSINQVYVKTSAESSFIRETFRCFNFFYNCFSATWIIFGFCNNSRHSCAGTTLSLSHRIILQPSDLFTRFPPSILFLDDINFPRKFREIDVRWKHKKERSKLKRMSWNKKFNGKFRENPLTGKICSRSLKDTFFSSCNNVRGSWSFSWYPT